VLHGIGIDIHEKKRFLSVRSLKTVMRQLFTPLEIDQGVRYTHPQDHWSKLFACKEAVLKACAIGLYFGSYWLDITIDKNDKVTLRGKIKKHLAGIPKVLLSHACSRRFAIGCAIITT
jgi:phosphopantetheine--protein transferase-like protein